LGKAIEERTWRKDEFETRVEYTECDKPTTGSANGGQPEDLGDRGTW